MGEAAMSATKQGTNPETLQEHWWEFCPICNAKLVNHKCRFVCSNPECHFFMSCSEFDR
jgi:hypothetical protein